MSAKPEELLDTAAAKEYQSGLQEYLLQHKINNAFSNIFDGLAVDLPDDPIPYIARLLKSRYPREMRHWNHPDIDGYVTPPPEEEGGEAGDEGGEGDEAVAASASRRRCSASTVRNSCSSPSYLRTVRWAEWSPHGAPSKGVLHTRAYQP